MLQYGLLPSILPDVRCTFDNAILTVDIIAESHQLRCCSVAVSFLPWKLPHLRSAAPNRHFSWTGRSHKAMNRVNKAGGLSRSLNFGPKSQHNERLVSGLIVVMKDPPGPLCQIGSNPATLALRHLKTNSLWARLREVKKTILSSHWTLIFLIGFPACFELYIELVKLGSSDHSVAKNPFFF